MRIMSVTLFCIVLVGCVSAPQPQPDIAKQVMARDFIDQGAVEFRLGKLDQARANFEIAYQMGLVAPALDGIGCIEFRYGNLNLAEQYFRKAYASDSKYVKALANIALVCDKLGKVVEAEKLYREVVRRAPQDPQAHAHFARFLERNGGDLAEVRSEYLKAQATDSGARLLEVTKYLFE